MNNYENIQISIISEKVLAEKIKSVIWNRDLDILAINCGNYYEIHRIGSKHEIILKKEEVAGINEILFSNENDLLVVILKDASVYYINIATHEIVLKTKILSFKSPIAFNRTNSIQAQIFQNKKISNSTYETKNPFEKDLNFISFSKIDVSLIQFFQNQKEKSLSYIFNKDNRELEVFLNFLVPILKFKIQDEVNSLSKLNNDSFTYLHKDNTNLILKTISLENILNNTNTVNLLYQLTYAIHSIDYIQNLLTLFSRIINKLGLILFDDKYLTSNKLEHEAIDKEEFFKAQFQKELKDLLALGIINNNIKKLFDDIYEARTLLKLDENIYFNLKNIEDLLTDNIRPALNSIMFFICQISSCSNIKDRSLIKLVEDKFSELFVRFEKFFNKVIDTKSSFRNFLAWVNSFNSASQNDITKCHLNGYIIDYSSLQSFIDNQGYNMTQLIDFIDKDHEIVEMPRENMDSTLLNDEVIGAILSKNGLTSIIVQAFNSSGKGKNSETSLKTKLLDIKDLFTQIKAMIITSFSEQVKLTQTLILKNNSNIEIIKTITDSLSQSIYIRFKVDFTEYLLILNIDSLNSVNKYAILQFSFSDSTIIDFDINGKDNLIVLVGFKDKTTIALSKLPEYIFTNILGNELNLTESIKDTQVIKVHRQLDTDNSDNSFLSCGERGMISIIDNRKNKISIIDLLN